MRFDFDMKAYVKIIEGLNGMGRQVRLIAPAFERHDEFPELGTPIAQMVDAHDPITQMLVYPVQGVANDRGAQMPDAKWLGNIGGGVIDDDRLARALCRFPVLAALSHDGTQGGSTIDQAID